jgi:hypothetical protein
VINQYEWRVLALWSVAIAATAIVAGQSGALILGAVFFVCMVGSLMAIRRAAAHHVEWLMVALWVVATAAMLVVTADSHKGNVLGPLYFVCMVGSALTARKAHAVT